VNNGKSNKAKTATMSAHLKTCGQNGEKAMCSLENTWTKE